MNLRTIAALIGAILCIGGSARAEEFSLSPRSPTLEIAPAVGHARRIPYLPAPATETRFSGLLEGASGSPESPHENSTVLRELVIAGVAIGGSFLLDDRFPPGSNEGGAVDNIGQFAGSPYTLAAAGGILALGGKAAHSPRTVDLGKELVLSVASTTLTVAVLKLASQRERPDGSSKYSFPSGHAGASFAAATVLDREYGGAVGWAAYGFAAFVGASRVVGNHHYFSDVVTGAVVGRFYGRLFTRRHH
jgi:membrane-associated phospholipid phosphatase